MFSCCLINKLIVKFLVLFSHVEKELAGRECRAVVLLESAHMIHKFTSSHGVGVSKQIYFKISFFFDYRTQFRPKYVFKNNYMKYIMNFSKVWISHQQSETILTGNHDMVINQSINQSFRDALLSTYQPPD